VSDRQDRYINRRLFFLSIIILVSGIMIVKLFIIQVVDKSYRMSAENNVIRHVTQYPARGLIYDRNDKLLVYNQAAYDLMVIPGQMTEIDTVALCSIIGISEDSFNRRLSEARSFSKYAPSIFLKMVSAETYALFQETLYQFPGFYVQTRTLRKYTHPSASHVMGYVSEVDASDLESGHYYRMGDYIGKSGVEESYENELRGDKGVKRFLVDVHNRIKGSYQNGRHDSIPRPGKDIQLSLDIDLQMYGEKLLSGKNGSIVAIEPKTGEVLALISAPYYDPSLLIGRIRSDNFRNLQSDTLKPLFNRALMAYYPPGSTFKPVNGLIALQEGVLNERTEYFCDNGYYATGIHVACHHFDYFNLPNAIMASCNAYFCNAFRRTLENSKYGSTAEAYSAWRSYLEQFGFGSKLGIDLDNELSGFVPQPAYYDKYYGEGNWKALTVLSLAIGQGELGTTPLQMANMTAAIANRGYYYTPHIVKEISGNENQIGQRFTEKHDISIDSANFEPVVEGMRLVLSGDEQATARWVALKDIEVCGKTGTAENSQGEDHSIFIAFAPADDPQIAIAVYVEGTGFGSTYAAPAATLMIEKYLKGEISNPWLEDFILKEPEQSGKEN
jgi:penicillin-binding protein 2